MARKGTPHSSKLQDWSFPIRWLSVISRTLFEREGLTPFVEMQLAYFTAAANLAKVDLGIIASKGMSTLPWFPELETFHQISVKCHTLDTPFGAGQRVSPLCWWYSPRILSAGDYCVGGYFKFIKFLSFPEKNWVNWRQIFESTYSYRQS